MEMIRLTKGEIPFDIHPDDLLTLYVYQHGADTYFAFKTNTGYPSYYPKNASINKTEEQKKKALPNWQVELERIQDAYKLATGMELKTIYLEPQVERKFISFKAEGKFIGPDGPVHLNLSITGGLGESHTYRQVT